MTDPERELDTAPRREASARLDIDGEVGSATQLREAMDPANQSLTEALQLSFRVLQLAIVVLAVLFLFSGFRTVGNGESGVATVWGRIVDPTGLEPGLATNWPPPIGDFVLFQAESRTVTDANGFVPRALLAHGEARSIQKAVLTDRLKPDRDGSFLTVGGEIGHIRVQAQYSVSNPAQFLETIGETGADELVQLALQRAVVQIGANHSLHMIREVITPDGLRSLVRDETQALLDMAGSGLRVTTVDLKQKPLPPAAIQKDFEAYSRVRQEVAADIEGARQDAQETLLSAAGPAHVKLGMLISEYEHAYAQGNPGDSDAVLARIDTVLDGDDVTGQVARVIDSARRHRVNIEQTLGSEARLFAGLQGAYRENPEAVLGRRWLETIGRVYEQPDIEFVQVPSGLGLLSLNITGSQTVKDLRRSLRLDRVDAETWSSGFRGSALDQFQDVSEVKMDRAGRQLAIDEKGRVGGLRSKE